MKEIEELAELLSRQTVDREPDDELIASFSWPLLIAKLTNAGENELAAKAWTAARKAGRYVEVNDAVRAADLRLRAQKGAETSRKINRINNTNHPLPAWIRKELGEQI